MMRGSTDPAWPELSYAAWKETCATLHLWTQIVGKVRLSFTPWLNHSWHVPLYVTTRGLTTSPIPFRDGTFEIEFDFHEGMLRIATSEGASRQITLASRTVADFHALVLSALGELGIPAQISDMPCEIPDAIPFQPRPGARRL